MWIEPDRRHVDLVTRSFGMMNAKGVETPDVKKSADQRKNHGAHYFQKEAMSEYRRELS